MFNWFKKEKPKWWRIKFADSRNIPIIYVIEDTKKGAKKYAKRKSREKGYRIVKIY